MTTTMYHPATHGARIDAAGRWTADVAWVQALPAAHVPGACKLVYGGPDTPLENSMAFWYGSHVRSDNVIK